LHLHRAGQAEQVASRSHSLETTQHHLPRLGSLLRAISVPHRLQQPTPARRPSRKRPAPPRTAASSARTVAPAPPPPAAPMPSTARTPAPPRRTPPAHSPAPPRSSHPPATRRPASAAPRAAPPATLGLRGAPAP